MLLAALGYGVEILYKAQNFPVGQRDTNGSSSIYLNNIAFP